MSTSVGAFGGGAFGVPRAGEPGGWPEAVSVTSEGCPCGGGCYHDCCGPLHAGLRQAPTAESLMRSRYSAYALGLGDYVFRTWHPATRPVDVDADGPRWLGLTIVEVLAGGVDDERGEVEFVARHEGGELHERSLFERRAGRWFYRDAVG